MLRKLKKAITNPKQIVPYLVWYFKYLQVRKVVKDGQLFHKYKGTLYPDYLDHGDACSFIYKKALKYCKGNGIDIGASKWPLQGAIPVRDEPHQNAYKLNSFKDGSLDFVFSSHCLEHLDCWQDALPLWIKKLNTGGILFLYLPHESNKLWHPGAPYGGLGHKWIPNHEVLIPFLSENGVEIIDYNPSKDDYWSFHIIGRKAAHLK